MKNLQKLTVLLLALVMVISMMAGCSGNSDTQPSDDGTEGTQAATDGTQATGGDNSSAEGPQYGGHLNVALSARMDALDPLTQVNTWYYMWTTCVWQNPLTRDADNNIRPGVCDFEISDDELVLKLWVRDGMTFSNGDPVDIYDVEASVNRHIQTYKSSYKYNQDVESVVVEPDGKTLTITLSKYNDNFYHYLAAYQTWCAVMPKEICEKYMTSTITNQKEDCIGTGPYYITEFVGSTELTLTKRDNYTPVESEYTGHASTQYGYLDTITFYRNMEGSSRIMGLFGGQYDLVDFMAPEYVGLMEQGSIVVDEYRANNGCWVFFNTFGANNVCAKYPSLRKAVMAAIDYKEYLSIITDDQQTDAKQPILDPKYDTDIFINADYYGDSNIEVAKKYAEAAKAEGWNGTDPITYVGAQTDADVMTMTKKFLGEAGIPFDYTTMDSAAVEEFCNNPNNNWDFRFSFTTSAFSPSTLQVGIVDTFWNSSAKDALLLEMRAVPTGSEEYMQKWEEFANLWVDECATAFMSIIKWQWFHDADLVMNDDDTVQRYFFNTYWKNPSEHPKQG